MIQTTSKKGRPQFAYRAANGTLIPGLRKIGPNRWCTSAPDRVTFTERDEGLAISRYLQIMAKRKGAPYSLGTTTPSIADGFETLSMLRVATQRDVTQFPATLDGTIAFEIIVDEAAFWSKVRAEIINRPLYAAKMTGIEQLGYLDKVLKPDECATLEEIGNLYAEKPGLSPNEAGRSKLFWGEFTKAVGVKTAREIDHNVIALYERKVLGGAYAPKSRLHRYRKIRTIFAYAIKRGKDIENCRRALDATAMLEVKNAHPLDPKPISPALFWMIYAQAINAGDQTFAAMMLVSLNMAAYAGEASALRWEEINMEEGTLTTHRPKTGVSRVAVLWPETLAALKLLPHNREYVFNTSHRSYTVISALGKWRKYREAAGLGEEVTMGQIRDASFSIACRVSLDQAKALAGHKFSGNTDNYLARNPEFVAGVCKAIRTAFFEQPQKPVKKQKKPTPKS